MPLVLLLLNDIVHLIVSKHHRLLLVENLCLPAGSWLHMLEVVQLHIPRVDVLLKADDLVFVQGIDASVQELMLHHGHGLEVVSLELFLQLIEVDNILRDFRFFLFVFFYHIF